MKLRITVEGRAYEVDVEVLDEDSAGPAAVQSRSAAPSASTSGQPSTAPKPVKSAPSAAPRGSADGDVQSPIAGTVLSVSVKVGDVVKVNDTLMILEAMKMESNVASPLAGTVREICVKAGDAVAAGACLVRLDNNSATQLG